MACARRDYRPPMGILQASYVALLRVLYYYETNKAKMSQSMQQSLDWLVLVRFMGTVMSMFRDKVEKNRLTVYNFTHCIACGRPKRKPKRIVHLRNQPSNLFI